MYTWQLIFCLLNIFHIQQLRNIHFPPVAHQYVTHNHSTVPSSGQSECKGAKSHFASQLSGSYVTSPCPAAAHSAFLPPLVSQSQGTPWAALSVEPNPAHPGLGPQDLISWGHNYNLQGRMLSVPHTIEKHPNWLHWHKTTPPNSTKCKCPLIDKDLEYLKR